MTPEDVRHLRAVRRARGGGTDDFGRLAAGRGAQDRQGDDGELFHILAAEVIEAVHRAARDAQRLPGCSPPPVRSSASLDGGQAIRRRS